MPARFGPDDHNNGWLARGGLLHLRDDHLAFRPNPMERLLLARRLRIDFRGIRAVERHPSRPGESLPGGRAPRMRLVTEARTYDFVFPGASTTGSPRYGTG